MSTRAEKQKYREVYSKQREKLFIALFIFIGCEREADSGYHRICEIEWEVKEQREGGIIVGKLFKAKHKPRLTRV